jgi:hypothetical protein
MKTTIKVKPKKICVKSRKGRKREKKTFNLVVII